MQFTVTIVFIQKVEGFCSMYCVNTQLKTRMQSIVRSWKKNDKVYSIFVHENDNLIGVWHNANARIANQLSTLV